MQSKTHEFQTQNEGRGFHGEMELEYGADRAADLFAFAGGFLKGRFSISSQRAVEFLDSRGGRHFADRVADIAAFETEGDVPDAITKAADRMSDKQWRREIPEATV